MIITTRTIRGAKDKTVCYTIPWVQTETAIAWPEWRLYTPEGPEVELETGLRYIHVEAGSVELARDAELDKDCLLLVTAAGVELVEILEGAQVDPIAGGLEGDIVATATIPADTAAPITVTIKEVVG
jgi:hypothetical protein